MATNAFFPASLAAQPRGDVTFSGGYVSVGCFLTGENRAYDRRYGKYGRTTPFRLSEVIENFEEVQVALAGTEYEWMLVEQPAG